MILVVLLFLASAHALPGGAAPNLLKDADFYDGCGVKKTCFGAPAGCVETKNCKVATAVTLNGERYEFELKAVKDAQWAGVGLSDNNQMGDDSVIECVKDSTAVKSYLSYTSPRPNLRAERESNQNSIQLLEGDVIDGELYCRVFRETVTVLHGRVFDLATDEYHLLVAAGSSVRENAVNFHDVSYLASSEKKSLL